MRSLAAVVLVVVVPFGALLTPFVHAHADDHHQSHHDGRVVHAHLAPHAAPASGQHTGAKLEDDDAEHAGDVPLFVAVETSTFKVVLLVPGRFEAAVPPARVLSSRPRVAHAHDPPALDTPDSRGPPAFLS